MKRYGFTIILILTALLCFSFVGCSEQTEYDKYKAQGYTVTVTYDGNSGAFLESKSISLIDMFKPADYPRDADGTVHIKLMEPTDTKRPSGGSDPVTLIKQNYFFAGWYTDRVLKTNDAGEVLDWDGNVLVETNGVFYVKDSKEETIGYPACSSYSGLWNFETDTLDVKVGEEVEKTLYAGWVPYYEFDYYYKIVGDTADWKKYGTTSFDYKTTNKEGSTTSDRDTIFTPSYQGGAMKYSSDYADGREFKFPSLEGYTFNSAYSDAECKKRIVDNFEHSGTLDVSTGKAVNRVQNVYVLFDEGTIYKIEKAEELSVNGNKSGIYYINADLDFTDVTWPLVFMYNDFCGKFYGNHHVIRNVDAKFSSGSSKIGGLFGSVSGIITDVTFENLTVDYVATGYITECNFGYFSGEILADATVNVTLSGQCNLKFGKISLNTAVGGENIVLNLLAGGNNSGVLCSSEIKVIVYGIEQFGSDPKIYDYTINHETVKLGENRLSFNVEAGLDPSETPYYEFKYSIGG